MSYFTYGDKRIYYEQTGNGVLLLLLHGNTASRKMFAPISPLLSEKYREIVLDFLVCGQSDRVEKWPEDLWYQWSEQAVSAVVKWAAVQNGVNIIEAETEIDNYASKRVLEKVGFIANGVIGQEGPRYFWKE